MTTTCAKAELWLQHPCLLRFIAEQQEPAPGCCKASLTPCFQLRNTEQCLIYKCKVSLSTLLKWKWRISQKWANIGRPFFTLEDGRGEPYNGKRHKPWDLKWIEKSRVSYQRDCVCSALCNHPRSLSAVRQDPAPTTAQAMRENCLTSVWFSFRTVCSPQSHLPREPCSDRKCDFPCTHGELNPPSASQSSALPIMGSFVNPKHFLLGFGVRCQPHQKWKRVHSYSNPSLGMSTLYYKVIKKTRKNSKGWKKDLPFPPWSDEQMGSAVYLSPLTGFTCATWTFLHLQ